MKNLFRLSGCLLLAAILGLSSCIKNEVAPEVTQIRQAQIAKLTAEIESINLDNDYQALVNAYKEANDEQMLLEIMAEVEYMAAYYDRQEQEQKIIFAQKVAEYERFINQGQFQQNISDLLGKYNNESQVLQQLYSDRNQLTKEIAQNELLLTTNQYEIWQARYEDMIADLTSRLDAQNEALTVLETVLTDPSTVEAELIDVMAQIGDLNDQYDSLTTAYELTYNTWLAAEKKVDDANWVIDVMESWDPYNIGPAYQSGYLNDLEYANEDLADLNITITQANTTLALLNATLTANKNALTAATTAYNTQLANYNTLNTAYNNAVADVAYKTTLLNVAQQNLDAANAAVPATPPATITSLTAIRDAANVALTAANTTLTNANNSLTPATTAKNNAQTTMNNAQTAVNTAQSNVDSQKSTIESYNSTKTGLESYITVITAKIAEWQTKYDDATANIAQLEIDAALLSKKHILINIEMNKVNTLIGELENVQDDLENHLDDLEQAVIDMKLAIGATEDDIADVQALIGNNEIDKAWVEGQIAKLQSLLATTEVKITESEGIVAIWKKMLDEAIVAGN